MSSFKLWVVGILSSFCVYTHVALATASSNRQIGHHYIFTLKTFADQYDASTVPVSEWVDLLKGLADMKVDTTWIVQEYNLDHKTPLAGVKQGVKSFSSLIAETIRELDPKENILIDVVLFARAHNGLVHSSSHPPVRIERFIEGIAKAFREMANSGGDPKRVSIRVFGDFSSSGHLVRSVIREGRLHGVPFDTLAISSTSKQGAAHPNELHKSLQATHQLLTVARDQNKNLCASCNPIDEIFLLFDHIGSSVGHEGNVEEQIMGRPYAPPEISLAKNPLARTPEATLEMVKTLLSIYRQDIERELTLPYGVGLHPGTVAHLIETAYCNPSNHRFREAISKFQGQLPLDLQRAAQNLSLKHKVGSQETLFESISHQALNGFWRYSSFVVHSWQMAYDSYWNEMRRNTLSLDRMLDLVTQLVEERKQDPHAQAVVWHWLHYKGDALAATQAARKKNCSSALGEW